MPSEIDMLYDQFRTHGLIEAAGLFWLLAEVLILFAMTVADNHLRLGGREAFQWEQRYTRRLILWLALFSLLSLCVAGRHGLWPPAYTYEDTEVALRIGRHREQIHLVVWAIFVAGWVALEAAIVAYGVRAYGQLRKLLTSRESRT